MSDIMFQNTPQRGNRFGDFIDGKVISMVHIVVE